MEKFPNGLSPEVYSRQASFLVANEEFDNGLLISEVVVPGFDFKDHTFLKDKDELKNLVGSEKADELAFLV